MRGRVLFHVQHLLGIGHLKRAETLAAAMVAEGLDVMVAYGGVPLQAAPFAGVTRALLPAATIAGEDFSNLLDAEGRPVDAAWKAARRDELLRLYAELDPDVVLIELFPFGRRQFRFELLPLIEAAHARRPRPRIMCSLRDILVAKAKSGRDAEVVETLRRGFDAVLVHGDPDVVALGDTFSAAAEIADLVRYTGYVTAARRDTAAPPEAVGEVIVSAGGGAVGAPLLQAAMTARPATPLADRVWRFIAGPNLPASDFEALAAQAGPRTVVERFRADFPARLAVAALSISQAGYNTTMDLLAARTPAVVVPYETAGETEQRLRAELLAARGLLTVVPAAELSPDRLARAVADAVAKPPAAHHVSLAGASTSARLIRDFAAQRNPRA